jgi:hypothetical protein
MALAAGFDRDEALDLLYFCAAIESGLGMPILDTVPTGWASLFLSPEIGPFQNRWQLWRKGANGPCAIAIRGTIETAGSILDDLISVMVAAKGTLKVGALQTDYQFSDDAEAGVHLGFALGALLLLQDPQNGILAKLAGLGIGADTDIYVTGHSQGAAIATLIRSHLHYAGGPGLSYKTYVFAQPRPGNDHYAEDFELKFSDPGLAFRITNTLDWVTQVPFTLQFVPDIDKPNPLSVLASPSLLLTILGKAIDGIRDAVEAQARSRLQSSAVAVVRSQAPAAAPASPDLMATAFDVPIMPSLNFVNAGEDISLRGVPCSGAQCSDAFFEHHATTYYALLQVWPGV